MKVKRTSAKDDSRFPKATNSKIWETTRTFVCVVDGSPVVALSRDILGSTLEDINIVDILQSYFYPSLIRRHRTFMEKCPDGVGIEVLVFEISSSESNNT